MTDFEEVAGVELHPSGGDRSLPASALTRQNAGGQNPGSGDGREGVPNFATVMNVCIGFQTFPSKTSVPRETRNNT